MSSDPDPTSEYSLRSLFETALREYEKQAGTNLLNDSLTIKLQNCDSTDAISAVLQEQAQAFRRFRGDDGKLNKLLKQTVHAVLNTSSALAESTENFLRRLDIYTKIPPTTAMTEIIVKILVELLSTLALATQQVKQGRLSV